MTPLQFGKSHSDILKKQTLKAKVIIGYLSLILTPFKKGVQQTAWSDSVYWCYGDLKRELPHFSDLTAV